MKRAKESHYGGSCRGEGISSYVVVTKIGVSEALDRWRGRWQCSDKEQPVSTRVRAVGLWVSVAYFNVDMVDKDFLINLHSRLVNE